MKEECGSFMAALSVNVVTVNMLLSVFFLSGVFAGCDENRVGLFITAPKQMEALSGSCLQIPCSFRDKPGEKDERKMFDGSRETFGVWIKSDPKYGNNQDYIFNSSKSKNPFTMKIIGNLSQKNCTTLFYNLNTSQSDTYFFRIENEPFKATAECDPLNITVTDSPQRPRIEISGDVKDLKEKESVTITCSAFTPCPHSPPELTWNLQQDSHTQTEENTDGTFTTKIQQNITLSHRHDGYTITCSARYPVDGGKCVNTSETEETLSVSYAPKNTSASISPSGLVSAGSWVKLSCSSRAKPPVSSFTWLKISTEGPVNVSEGPIHSFNATDGGVYYCVAANKLGNQTSQEIRLIIEETFLISTLVSAMIAVCLLICLLLSVCHFKYKQPTAKQTQSGNQTQGEMFYEEFNHFKHRPEPSSTSVQDSSQQQEILCLQVNMSEPENSSTLMADVPKDHNIQSQTNDKLDFLMPAYETNEECLNEYMNVFERRPEPSSTSVQDSSQQQEILCLQVNMSEPENNSTLTADVPKDHNIQSQTNDKLDFLMPANKTNEECLYEVMNVFERRPKPSSVSVQDSSQQQEILCLQVNMSEPENNSTLTADVPKDHNIQVNMSEPENSSTLTADVPKDHNIQSQTNDKLDFLMPVNKTNEECLYEVMNVFERRPEPSSVSVQDSSQQQEILCLQVNMSEPENSSTLTADVPKDHNIQSQTNDKLDFLMPANKTNEECLYEVMNVFERRPEPSSVSVQDSSQQQEILCLQVNMSEPENSSTLTADVPKDHNIQSQTNDKLDFLMPAYKTNEECLYEVMNFFERRPEPSSVSVQDGRQQQQEEKKKESNPDSSLTQTTNDPNHLYASVKKHRGLV
ncbi:uncharacterized protein LOC121628601 isoform X2 [Melanotaenia boesemani]|uniref:uncharacterized protein LOC121628601 isoform X2 n=1 Tax=Melanotaenia boesemani TaxID=1250792 RepID=UPI001C03CE30|nr:uncharacterized protein LOC121628601 isoform X2 [Melanotaenia boesemani]